MPEPHLPYPNSRSRVTPSHLHRAPVYRTSHYVDWYKVFPHCVVPTMPLPQIQTNQSGHTSCARKHTSCASKQKCLKSTPVVQEFFFHFCLSVSFVHQVSPLHPFTPTPRACFRGLGRSRILHCRYWAQKSM